MAASVALEWVRPRLYPKQHEAVFNPSRFSVIEASTKSGKSLAHGTCVQTPAGPVPIERIGVGDKVFAVDGSACRVTGVYPQGVLPTYRVTFSDGTSVDCSADHLWTVWADRRDYRRGFEYRLRSGEVGGRRKDRIGWPRTVTTADLMQIAGSSLRRMWVRMPDAVEYPKAPVLLSPYLLGVLIAEGGLSGSCCRLSTADDHVLTRVRDEIPDGHELRYIGGYDWHITAGARAASMRESGAHINSTLRALGLHGKMAHEKRIPECYRRNSVSVRLEVLRGILDGDGSVDSAGQAVLEQTSRGLAEDVTEIVQSLGGTARTTVKTGTYVTAGGERRECRAVYRTRIRYPDCRELFSTPSKVAKASPKRKPTKRTFRSIVPAGSAACTCIAIDHPTRLYLTTGFVPTHNTAACMAWLSEMWAARGAPGREFWWVAPVYGQAKIAYNRLTGRGLPEDIFTTNRSDLTITSRLNGAVMAFKSAEKPDNLYGEDVHAAVLDEASRMRVEAWHAIRSTLTATRGPCRIIGNVKGRRNWAYKLARRAEAGELRGWSYHRITAWDAVAAGVLSRREILDAKAVLPEDVYRELYLAEPTDDGANPFGLKYLKAATLDDDIGVGDLSVWGWDLGRKVDWTAGIGLDPAGQVGAFERWQRHWPQTVRSIIESTAGLPALVDQTGLGDPVVEALQEHHDNFEGFLFSPQSKQDLIGHLILGVQSRQVQWRRRHAVLIHELENIEYLHTRTGVRYGAPEGYHDDCVMALALAYRHLKSPHGQPVIAW